MSINSNRDLRYQKSRNKRIHRPKTFKTEEAAKAYALKNKIKEYTLVNLKSSEAKTKKLRIMVKE
jgi:hypothetical protein